VPQPPQKRAKPSSPREVHSGGTEEKQKERNARPRDKMLAILLREKARREKVVKSERYAPRQLTAQGGDRRGGDFTDGGGILRSVNPI